MEHLRLFELNRLIRDTLDKHLEPAYWVVAEIGEMREARNGHCYLELVEKSDDKVIAKIRGNIWAYTYRGVAARFRFETGQEMKAGMSVLCQVSVTFHEMYGLSLNIRDIDPAYTLGERARRRQEIIDKLIADGVFEMNKSLQLPHAPQRIAVISSPTAAGYGDFMDQLSNNPHRYAFHTVLFKAIMQGEQSPGSLIEALHEIHSSSHSFDLVVIIRGGGSQIDLDCFDHYELAAHVAQFPLPVVTGIGHERDETILDLVAHTRMKTPTAVAEFLVGGLRAFEEQVLNSFAMVSKFARDRMNFESQRLQTARYRLAGLVKERLSVAGRTLDRRAQNLQSTSKRYLAKENERLTLAQRSVALLDPATILQRGYTITRADGVSVSKKMPGQGQSIETITATGLIKSTVNETKENE